MPVVIAAFFGSLFGGERQDQHRSTVALVQLDRSEIGDKIGAGLQGRPRAARHDDAASRRAGAVRKGKQRWRS